VIDPSRTDADQPTPEALDFPIGADRPPTADEARTADELAEGQDPEVGGHYKEMIERGAHVKGEGQIE